MDSNATPVTVGVAVRYEDADSLRLYVRRLAEASHLLDALTETEVCFCLNGASSETKRYLEEALRELSDPDLRFTCLESPPGKIRAHGEIARNRQLNGFLLFVDADVRFESGLFLQLYQFLKMRADVYACYAEVEALPSVAGRFFGRLQNAYYRNRHRFNQRAHLHGRCFMMRSWVEEFGALHSPTVTLVERPVDPLGLQHGPIVDDMHYSRVLVNRFGPESIAIVPDARVKFVPPHSLAELYRDSCRTEFELVRLNALFPEHTPIEHKVFKRHSGKRRVWQAFRRAGLFPAAYVCIEMAMRRISRFKARRRLASLAEAGICPSTNSVTPREVRESSAD